MKFKIVIIKGEIAVGTTCFLSRYLHNYFEINSGATIGACFSRKRVRVNDEKSAVLDIWETTGLESGFINIKTSLVGMYLRNVQSIILVFRLSSPESFDQLVSRFQMIKKILPENVHYTLVATQCDLPYETSLSERAAAFAKEFDMKYFITSAKKKIGIEECFADILNTLSDRFIQQPQNEADATEQVAAAARREAQIIQNFRKEYRYQAGRIYWPFSFMARAVRNQTPLTIAQIKQHADSDPNSRTADVVKKLGL